MVKAKKILALILAAGLCMTSVPDNVFASQQDVTEQASQVAQSSTQTTTTSETTEGTQQVAVQPETTQTETTAVSSETESQTSEASSSQTTEAVTTETQASETTNTETVDTETESASLIQSQSMVQTEGAVPSSNVTESYIQLLTGAGNVHADTVKSGMYEDYKFIPENTGWYHLAYNSDNDIAISQSITYYTDDGNGATTENISNSRGVFAAKSTDQIFYAKAGNEYNFSVCGQTSNTASYTIGVYTANIQSMSIQGSMENNVYDSIDFTGLSLEIDYTGVTDGDPVSTVSSITSDGQINSFMMLSGMNYDYNDNAFINSWLGNITYVDELNNLINLSSAADGNYTWKTTLSQSVSGNSQVYELSSGFTLAKNEVESISNVTVEKNEYTKGVDSGIGIKDQKYTFQINYKESTGKTAVTKTLNGYSSDISVYTKDEQGNPVSVSNVDEYLNNHSDASEMTVYLAYRGVETSFTISILDSKYTGISAELNTNTFYADAGSDNYLWFYVLKSLTLNTSEGSTTYSSTPDYNTTEYIYNLPYYNNIQVELEKVSQDGLQLYTSVRSFLDAGGSLGANTIKVSYGGVSTEIPVTLVENPYTSIEVTPPSKLTYIHNMTADLNLSGLQIKAVKADGTYDVYSYDSYLAQNRDSETAYVWQNYFSESLGGHNNVQYLEVGTHTVNLTFMGLKGSYDISVNDSPLSKLSISSPPTQSKLAAGSNMGVSTSGLKLSFTLNGVEYTNLDANSSEMYSILAPYNAGVLCDTNDVKFDTAGTYPVTISLLGMEATYYIQIVDKPLQNLQVSKMPTKLNYTEGASSWIDSSGMKLSFDLEGVHYSDIELYSTQWNSIFSSYTTMFGISDTTVDYTKAGDYQVTVKVLGATAQYTIHVIQSPVKDVTIAQLPTVTKCVKGMNSYPDYTGMKINYTDTATGVLNTNISINSSQMNSLFSSYGYPIYTQYPDLTTSGTKTAKLNILGTVVSYAIDVVDSPISDFTISTPPTKSEGLVGNSSYVTLEGMKISFTYDGNSYQDIAYNSPQLTALFGAYGFTNLNYNSGNINWKTIGTYQIPVYFLGQTATFDYNVIQTPVTDLQITKQPAMTTLIKNSGNMVNMSGMQVSFKLNGTQYTDVDIYSSQMYALASGYGTYVSYTTPDDFDLSVCDTYTFKVNVLGATADFDIQVVDSPLSNVSIAKAPDNTKIIKGNYPYLSYSGLHLNYTYQGKDYKNIDVESSQFYTIINTYHSDISINAGSLNTTTTGTYDVILKILGSSLIYQVDVVDAPISNFKISTLPNKTKYVIGSQDEINLYGLKVSFDYNGVAYTNVSPTSDEVEKICSLYGHSYFTYNGLGVDLNTLGSYQVKVSLLGCSAQYTIQVLNEAVKEIKVLHGPTSIAYAGFTRYIDFTGMEIQVTELDGKTTKYLAYTENKTGYGDWNYIEDDLSWNTTGIDWKTAGSYDVPITYNGKSTSFQYTVSENPVASITIEQMPAKTIYIDRAYEPITLKGLKCTIHYKDQTKADSVVNVSDDASRIQVGSFFLSENEWKEYQEDSDEPAVGNNAIIISYMGVTAEIPATIVTNPVSSVECTKNPDKNYAFGSTSVDLYGAQFKINYLDGTTQLVDCTEHYALPVVNNTDENMVGIKTDFDYQSEDNTVRFSIANVSGKIQLDKTDFTNITTTVISDGAVVPVTNNHTVRYSCYKFVPKETKEYHFYTLGDQEIIGAVYDTDGNLVASEYENGIDSNFQISETLTKDNTYYLVTMMYYMNDLSISRPYTVCLSSSCKDETIAANKILQSTLTMAAPVAGQSLSEAVIADTDSKYTVTSTWTNDSGNDKIADYATAQKAVITVHPTVGYSFLEGAAVTLNGKAVQSYRLSDGSLRFTYTFPFTDCKVTLPTMAGYQFHGAVTSSYDSDYVFTYTKSEGITADLLVKAGDEILTADADGNYTVKNLKTALVVSAKVIQQAATANRTLLQFYDGTLLKDTISALTGKTVVSNDKETTLPVLESYTDSSNLFFYGWFTGKDVSNNGTGTRFTSKSTVPSANPSSYYAKWGQGIFTYTYNGKTVHYKILSIDENNKIKVQVGDGANPAITAESVDNTGAIDATGATDGVIIPSDFSDLSQLSAELGVDLSGCSVTAIANNAFSGLTDLTSVTLPDTIQTVGEGAFSGCSNLTELNLGSGTMSLGANVFNGCSSLTTLSIPGTLTSVDAAAFSGLPASVTISCDADSASVLQDAIDAAGAAVSLVTHALTLDYNSSTKNFTYGDNSYTIKADDQLSSGTATMNWTGAAGISTYYTLAINNTAGTIRITPIKATNKPYQIMVTDGVVSKTVTLTTASASLGSRATISSIADVTYTGSALRPAVTVKLSASGTTLSEGTDYTLTYSNNTNTGTATVTVTGLGNYSGTLIKNFTIKAVDSASSGTTGGSSSTVTTTSGTSTETETVAKSISVDNYTQTYKKNGTFQITVSNAEGTVSYSSSNLKVASVDSSGIVTMKGRGKAVITISAANGTITSTVWVVPSKNSIKSLKSSSKKKISISWKKDTTATGYSIEVSNSSDFSKIITTKVVTKNKTTSTTVNKLVSKTTYYVRIRSFIKSGSEYGYSEYSVVKKVKIK